MDSLNRQYGIDLSKAPTDPIKFQDFVTTNFSKDQIQNLNKMVLGLPPQTIVTPPIPTAQTTNPYFDFGALSGLSGYGVKPYMK